MPEYEYECPVCGYEADLTWEDLYFAATCAKCGELMRRVYSAPAVLWQGGKPSGEVQE